jgi:hypothetical protein
VRSYQQVMNNPPTQGTVLTVKHFGYSPNGKLKHPYFWRERTDLTWDNVLSQKSMEIKKHKVFMDQLGKKLGFKHIQDWYNIKSSDILSLTGGAAFLHYYGNSPMSAVQSIYPEYTWIKNNFVDKQSNSYNEDTLKEFVKSMENKLQIKSLDDWYRVSLKQINQFSPLTIIQNSEGLAKLLAKVYPEKHWDMKRFSRIAMPSKASQRMMKIKVENLFPNEGRINVIIN